MCFPERTSENDLVRAIRSLYSECDEWRLSAFESPRWEKPLLKQQPEIKQRDPVETNCEEPQRVMPAMPIPYNRSAKHEPQSKHPIGTAPARPQRSTALGTTKGGKSNITGTYGGTARGTCVQTYDPLEAGLHIDLPTEYCGRARFSNSNEQYNKW